MPLPQPQENKEGKQLLHRLRLHLSAYHKAPPPVNTFSYELNLLWHDLIIEVKEANLNSIPRKDFFYSNLIETNPMMFSMNQHNIVNVKCNILKQFQLKLQNY